MKMVKLLPLKLLCLPFFAGFGAEHRILSLSYWSVYMQAYIDFQPRYLGVLAALLNTFTLNFEHNNLKSGYFQ